MPIFQKTVRACDLPNNWQLYTASPNQLVVVTISDNQSSKATGIEHQHQLSSFVPTKDQQKSLANGLKQAQQNEFVPDSIMNKFWIKHDCV